MTTSPVDTIHGFPVIASFNVKPVGNKTSRVIIVDRGETYKHDRYVSAMHNVGDADWYYGDYYNTLEKAPRQHLPEGRRHGSPA